MCFGWGLPLWQYDAAPRRYRMEMLMWYSWRNQRRAAARKTADLNRQDFAQRRR